MNIEEVFEYNQHFVAMMNIINFARITNKEGKFEKHHIVPRCWFKKHNLPVDNSENNLVKLTIEQHKKVHKLAAYCAKEEIKSSLKCAAAFMNRESVIGDKNPFFGQHHSEEVKKKISEARKCKSSPTKGKYFSFDTRKKMSDTHKGHSHPHKGHIVSVETKKKISEFHKGKTSPNKGKQLSEETRRKLSIARKGMHWKLVDGRRVYYV